MQATVPTKSLRSFLPRGQTLPADVFARRHLWMRRLLLAHAIGLPLFGIAQGFSVGHSLLDGLPIAAIALALPRVDNRRACASLMAIGLLTSSAVLVHLWHGAIEAHFHFFVMIPLLALYEDWIPFLLAVAYVAIHHGAMGAIDPGSVYNHADAVKHPWKWASIHGLFVAAAGAVSIVSWRLNEDMREQTRSESQRRAEAEAVSASLQRGLRPDRLPTLAQGAVAARYLPGGTREIGGDWYDVVSLDDGKVALTVGEVAGHGVLAASQMAALRNATRAYAHEGFSPAQVAHRIDRFFQGEFATFVYLLFDPGEGVLRFANAGHLPPLLLSPTGAATFLSESRSPPLGLEQDVRFEEGVVEFPPGATVLAYTDGLIERRTDPIDRQLERLRTAVAGVGPDAEIACDRALAAFPPDGIDDVALLAFQASPVMSDAFDVPAHPTALAGARQRLRAWLADIGVGGSMANDLVLLADEALTNAILHSGTERPAQVELACLDGTVRITVRDFGRWADGRSDPDHGRGLLLMDALADRLDVVRAEDSTTVTVARALRDPGSGTPHVARLGGGSTEARPESAARA
jgi:anti-sigma regulatory factor (Ser/Thr protein kinase)